MEIIARKTRYASPLHNGYRIRADVLMLSESSHKYASLTGIKEEEFNLERSKSRLDDLTVIDLLDSMVGRLIREGFTKNEKLPLLNKTSEYFTFEVEV